MSTPQTGGPVVFGYDGSALAGFAITQAAVQLAMPRNALVVCVWQPADVGFTPVGGQHFDADRADEVRAAAEQTAAHGAAWPTRPASPPGPRRSRQPRSGRGSSRPPSRKAPT